MAIEWVYVVSSHELYRILSTVSKTQLGQSFLFASLCLDSHMHFDNECDDYVQVMNMRRRSNDYSKGLLQVFTYMYFAFETKYTRLDICKTRHSAKFYAYAKIYFHEPREEIGSKDKIHRNKEA